MVVGVFFVVFVMLKEMGRILQETRLVILICCRALNPSVILRALGFSWGCVLVAQVGCYTVFGKHSACVGSGAFAFLVCIITFPGAKRERGVNVDIVPPAAPENHQSQVRRIIRYGGWAGRHNALLDLRTRSSHALTQADLKIKKIGKGAAYGFIL